jgi:hypothetical protein
VREAGPWPVFRPEESVAGLAGELGRAEERSPSILTLDSAGVSRPVALQPPDRHATKTSPQPLVQAIHRNRTALGEWSTALLSMMLCFFTDKKTGASTLNHPWQTA